jgi:cell division protein FtsN
MDSATKPVQLDLFSKINRSEESKGFEFAHRLSSRINLSWESIIVVAIFITLSFLLSFSLGVERGKRQAAGNDPAKSITVTRENAVPSTTTSVSNAVFAKSPALKVAPQRGEVDIFPKVARNPAPNQVKVIQIVSEADKASPGARKYTIQVASFSQDGLARQEEAGLKGQGYKTILKTSGQFRSLCVGSFNDKQEAETILRKLRSKYHDCFIRRL